MHNSRRITPPLVDYRKMRFASYNVADRCNEGRVFLNDYAAAKSASSGYPNYAGIVPGDGTLAAYYPLLDLLRQLNQLRRNASRSAWRTRLLANSDCHRKEQKRQRADQQR